MHFDHILVADTETTGFGPSSNVVEYAHAAVELVETDTGHEFRIVDEYSTLVNPNGPIPAPATAVHGITDEMVADAPDLAQALRPVNALEGSILMIGHNFIDYDWAYLDGRIQPTPQLGCTLRACRKLLDLKSNKLEAVYAATGGPQETAHRAAGDVRMTVAILNHLLKVVSWSMLLEIMQTEQLPTVMPFGKHKGKPIAELPKDYLEWALANMERLDAKLRKALTLSLEAQG